MSSAYHTKPHFAKSEADILYFAALKKQVYQVVDSLPRQRRHVAAFKACLLPAIYFTFYGLTLMTTSLWIFFFLYCTMGIMLVIIFLNLIHEACHDNLFRSKKVNKVYMLLFDIMGANSYMWKKRHNRLHHYYTNVQGWDSDIEKSKFLKVHPDDSKKLFNRYQHLLIVLYPLFITNWFLVRDFKDFFDKKTIVRQLGIVPLVEYVKLFFFKILFVLYLFVIPLLVTPFNWTSILLALLMLLVSAGFFALVVLLPPHVNTNNAFPLADENLQLPQSWLRHQLHTTNDVDNNNWITRHIMGNFNYHIAHHLFPNISYVYAKEVTEVIKKHNLSNGYPYRSYPLLFTFTSHYRLIKQNGKALDILDDDM